MAETETPKAPAETEPEPTDTVEAPTESTPADDLRTIEIVSEVEVRDLARREIDIRVVPWDVQVDSRNGPEEFRRGAFAGVVPGKVVLRQEHQNPPAGKGIAIEERADGAYMTFRVSKTQTGDEILALAADGVTTGASPGFIEVPGGTSIEYRNGRRVRVHRKSDLREVSTTWLPTYEQSAVLAIRSQPETGVAPMAETQEAPASGAPETPIAPTFDIEPITRRIEQSFATFADRLHNLEERSRMDIAIPGGTAPQSGVTRGQWMSTVVRILGGERVSELETRAMADLITTDNLGVVPEAFSAELLGVIDAGRPFLGSTRRVPTPDSGMTLNMPVLTTRPTAGVQVNEKDDIVSTETSITSAGFDAVTIAGGGDISLQLLKRSSPSYLDLYFQLLAEALSENAEAEAIAALLAAGVTAGTGALDPNALTIGESWGNANAAKQRADTIWLSSEAVGLFIDAKVNGTNAPLYSNIASDITVGGGARGTVSGLRPVFVPALDGTGVDVLIGPSRGFAWAEDGAFNLQVDVPGKAGRDVALVVIDWYAPLYPAAFTTYAV